MTHSRDAKPPDTDALWATYREAEANLRAAKERERDAKSEANQAETRRMNAATAERRAWTELCKHLGKPDEDALDTERKVRARVERLTAEAERERAERRLEEEAKRREALGSDKEAEQERNRAREAAARDAVAAYPLNTEDDGGPF